MSVLKELGLELEEATRMLQELAVLAETCAQEAATGSSALTSATAELESRAARLQQIFATTSKAAEDESGALCRALQEAQATADHLPRTLEEAVPQAQALLQELGAQVEEFGGTARLLAVNTARHTDEATEAGNQTHSAVIGAQEELRAQHAGARQDVGGFREGLPSMRERVTSLGEEVRRKAADTRERLTGLHTSGLAEEVAQTLTWLEEQHGPLLSAELDRCGRETLDGARSYARATAKRAQEHCQQYVAWGRELTHKDSESLLEGVRLAQKQAQAEIEQGRDRARRSQRMASSAAEHSDVLLQLFASMESLSRRLDPQEWSVDE